MNNLADLKREFERNGIAISSSKGYAIETAIGKFTMTFESVYHNNKKITPSELRRLILNNSNKKDNV